MQLVTLHGLISPGSGAVLGPELSVALSNQIITRVISYDFIFLQGETVSTCTPPLLLSQISQNIPCPRGKFNRFGWQVKFNHIQTDYGTSSCFAFERSGRLPSTTNNVSSGVDTRIPSTAWSACGAVRSRSFSTSVWMLLPEVR
jgi:hypothetical protein